MDTMTVPHRPTTQDFLHHGCCVIRTKTKPGATKTLKNQTNEETETLEN